MVMENYCDCGESLVERMATLESPYRFSDCGLPNVYLAGIKYYVCPKCGHRSAEIPYLKDLLVKIARAVVQNELLLNHYEIRFLRKRLGKKSSEFAKIIGVRPEHLSRLESANQGCNTSKSVDRLIRVYYSLLSGDKTLKDIMNRHIDEYMTSLQDQAHITEVRAALHDREWEAETVNA